jgi:hypothetical protein
MAISLEIVLIDILLLVLILAYVNILFGPSKQYIPSVTEKFIIQRDTAARWNDTLSQESKTSYRYDDFSSSKKPLSSKFRNIGDDYYRGGEEEETGIYRDSGAVAERETGPNKPSEHFRCPPHPPDWITIRSELNYKYLWLHGKENGHMSASATMDTPLHRKAFEVVPVKDDCSDGGWVMLREGDSKGFLRMVPPPPESPSSVEGSASSALAQADAWAVVKGSGAMSQGDAQGDHDHSYHFLLEEEGYVLNRGMLAFMNVIAHADSVVRGYSTASLSKAKVPKAARREYSAMMRLQFVNESAVMAAIKTEESERAEAADMDAQLVTRIKGFPPSSEVRVISFGLYGANEKYTQGAIRNTELAPVYFPGWICRFYHASDVPAAVLDKLRANGAQLIPIPDGKGYISGMFWRFLVASDPKVDRFIVRDADSRLNSRDALAVHEWIESGYEVHVLRDHVNQCQIINGGMWGGVRGSMDFMQKEVERWETKDQYLQDMNFLAERVWPLVKDKQLSHDSYCCDKFPNARPFPSKRPPTYQHVGQVFDSEDNERLSDIDGWIRSVPVPRQCRLHADWIYG